VYGLNRAFIFTLDAILAVILCSILFFSTYYLLAKFQYSVVRETALINICSDVLTSLEKNRTLQNSIIYSRTSDIRNVLNNLPSNTCSDLVIYSYNNKPLLITAKTGCNCTASRSLVVRSFVIPESNGTLSTYMAKMGACYT